MYLLFAWAGFWIGHVIGGWLGWEFGRMGTLNLGMAVVMMLTALALGFWLSLFDDPESA